MKTLGIASPGLLWERAGRIVGKLVRFERREREARSDDGSEQPLEAEILIFTGVRYEREAPSLPPKPSSSRGSKTKRG